MSTPPDRLDDLLEIWGRQDRLADEDAERVRLAVVREATASPPPVPSSAGLGATWWRDVTAQVNATVAQAMASSTGAAPGHLVA